MREGADDRPQLPTNRGWMSRLDRDHQSEANDNTVFQFFPTVVSTDVQPRLTANDKLTRHKPISTVCHANLRSPIQVQLLSQVLNEDCHPNHRGHPSL